MKHFSINLIGLLYMLVSLTSCDQTPQTKENYIQEYKTFLNDVSTNVEDYSKDDWTRIKKQHDQLAGEYYDKFESELTSKEKFQITKLQLKYNLLIIRDNATDFLDDLMVKDTAKLKEQLKYYTENDMQEDIDFILKQAQEIGSTAAEKVEEMFKELKQELKEIEEQETN